jgi:hypothetical protein
MPYITSIERMAKQEGREEGLLAGKIQMLQRVLAISVESEESLLQQTVEQLTEKLHDLQQRFEAQR